MTPLRFIFLNAPCCENGRRLPLSLFVENAIRFLLVLLDTKQLKRWRLIKKQDLKALAARVAAKKPNT